MIGLLAVVLASQVACHLPRWSARSLEDCTPEVGAPAGIARVMVFFANREPGHPYYNHFVQAWGFRPNPPGSQDGFAKRWTVPPSICGPNDSCAVLISIVDQAGNWVPRECEPRAEWRVK